MRSQGVIAFRVQNVAALWTVSPFQLTTPFGTSEVTSDMRDGGDASQRRLWLSARSFRAPHLSILIRVTPASLWEHTLPFFLYSAGSRGSANPRSPSDKIDLVLEEERLPQRISI